ncbi:MAG: inositol monophosphatase [Candidatus Omnitrophica bacterium CG12_big_fil_rev_8_21_14_0_65_43_15]|uniref:Inositol-1-monophosphatase n=1 Tax=Candidatus Taenaricola geysiri TaxID=1974752 RepID=A0A2J0LQA1_9BACT|nr:MAG: inositol monophosphatase [Candidatus Omnitrophica bacterium CG1_02_43_210]PIV12243.1 MAG: inositol monophosphatase [Candidatus Omnitrophica bacterium CG03_land_8_20_14_0_80_43_22]PIW66936.1 MAG: inositol monophosphatase [Candidatus Omnitrophica bacterium CG12_big_fil_rev_8_21_14_0_65_43_15]PIW79875.1 MAG: inositol monophosphatase [Candidatus Omnitrophica bacterium CG_4_8_14_3_um_filter_43_15]PIY83580.1 MAG: inositol monophosphatase [Candidatus Omnitrophica bacterium CG_4_10_14_0_8_um_fi
MRDSIYIKVAKEAAQKAGKYMIKRMGNYGRVSYKSNNTINLVTEVDKKSEEIIIKHIRRSFPEHDFLAEESGASRSKRSGYKWIIDPIDGTTNYAHSLGIFCASIGLEKNGQVIAGVVHDPSRDELFCAEKNKGAYLNNKRIHVSAVNNISESMLVTGFAYNIKEAKYTNIENFKNFLLASQAVRRLGSAAIDLCYVACGRFDGFWEVGLNPWDTAAGSLIAEEAGAELADFKGSKYSIYDKQILASNGKIHKQMLKILKKG